VADIKELLDKKINIQKQTLIIGLLKDLVPKFRSAEDLYLALDNPEVKPFLSKIMIADVFPTLATKKAKRRGHSKKIGKRRARIGKEAKAEAIAQAVHGILKIVRSEPGREWTKKEILAVNPAIAPHWTGAASKLQAENQLAPMGKGAGRKFILRQS